MSRNRLEDLAGLLGRESRTTLQQTRGMPQGNLDRTDRFCGFAHFRSFIPSMRWDKKPPLRCCQPVIVN